MKLSLPKQRGKRLIRALCAALAWCWLLPEARADVQISELLADNENGLADENGTRQDWIELYNSGDAAVNLDGWWLTDKASNLTQWRIPNVSIAAKGMLLVWASGKNRVNPAAPLHANFSLSKDGEYLGLYKPNPTNGLPVLADEYAPKFPALPSDVSYGRMFAQTSTTFVASGEIGKWRVLTTAEGQNFYTNSNYAAGHLGHGLTAGWNVSPAFNDSTWTNGATGIGYDTTGGFAPWIGSSPSGNCQPKLHNLNTSLCFRRLFYVPAPSNSVSMKLRMKYEDGFVAFINGTEVGRANCSNVLAYNTAANTALSETIVNSWTEFAFTNRLLVAGTNLLAIQGLNVTTYSSDFLLLPEIVGLAPGFTSTPVYFSTPTPGAQNNAGSSGPLLAGASPEDPDVPRPLGNASSPPLTVTVKVIKTKYNISAVRAYHRTMYNAESAAVVMLDNGVAPDAVTNDGIYSAILQTTNVLAGQMFRWRFEAQDVSNTVTKLPAYIDPLDSSQYFGTVAADPTTATSQLPVLEWFVQGSPANGPTAAAFRGSCYCLSNFYDNVGHEIHGQSTSGFGKKSYDFDFTDEDRFLWKDGERRVKDLNLLSNYADKTKTRNSFSHWVGMMAGTPYHYAFPVRVHLNGVFHGLLDMVENGGDRMLERNGLDPDGAFYKIYDPAIVFNAEKKTRKYEGVDDLIALTNGLATGKALATKQIYAYDNVDVAACVDYMVVRALNSDNDHGHKNYFLYRDSNVTREWRMVVWDVDLSQGHVWNSAENYFDDDLITNVTFGAGVSTPVYSIVWNAPEMKQMFVRRMRTLMDTLLQPPGTANGLFETQMRQIAATVDPDPADPSPWTDGDLDAARWGIDYRFLQNRPREEVERVIADYFAPRRSFLFNKGTGRPSFNGVNVPDAPQTNQAGMVVIDALDFLPAGNTQSNEYVILRNTTGLAVDISGWKLKGEISHTFKGGTVIPAGAGTAAANYVGLLHVVKDALSFRARTVGPTGGQRRFVQGNYSGQLSARGGTVRLHDAADLLVATTNYAGAPLPTQQSLRIAEIQYHPADPSPSESADLIGVTDDDFEYVELMNIGGSALTLTGAYFSQGLGYTFPTSSLAGGSRLVLAKNLAAFARRYPSVSAPVFGPYEGALDNSGERLELTDPCGENILDFEYKDGWYPASDGSGHSLVLRDTATDTGDFGNAVKWGLSRVPQGSPGAADVGLSQAYYGWDNFHFTESQRQKGGVGSPFADPDGDGRLNWVEYALGSDPWVADAEAVGFAFVPSGESRFAALSFRRPADALDVRYDLLATDDLAGAVWSVVGSAVHQATPLSGEREQVLLREQSEATAAKRFFRLRLTLDE
jgi:hypothetical protein